MKIRKINEVADDLLYPDLIKRKIKEKIELDYRYGYPFFYDLENNKMLIGKLGQKHEDCIDENNEYREGRFWKDKLNIISFWNYPDKNEWDKFIKLFEETTGLNTDDDDEWLVEIQVKDYDLDKFKDGGKVDFVGYRKYLSDKFNIPEDFIDKNIEFLLIPVDKYKSLNFGDFSEVEKENKHEERMKLYKQLHTEKDPIIKQRLQKLLGIKKGSMLKKKKVYENKVYKFEEFIKESKERIKMKIDLPKELYEVAKIYNKNGYDLFVVGGVVRDALQGKNPHDFDLVTNALPDETKKILKDWKGGNISNEEQGQNFGVLRLYTPNEPEGYEIATYREDISKGRDVKGDDEKVKIGKGVTIEDDVKRRDLTINALFYDINKEEIVDLVGGVYDLENGIVRTVGNPKERFDEDRLRILRTLRFSARSGSELDDETSDAIKEDNRLRGISPKDDVSQERIIEEFFKMFDYAKQNDSQSMFIYYLDLLDKYKMFKEMFLGIDVKYKNKYSYFNEFIILTDMFENNEDVEKKMKKVNFSNKISSVVSYLIRFKKEFNDIDKIYKLMKDKFRYDILDDLLLEYAKDQKMNIKDVKKFIEYCNSERISGKDLIEKGFKGKEIGEEQKRMEIKKFKDMRYE
jgi:tRNA nucleotidyltransferase (CCA-adding enzyme)